MDQRAIRIRSDLASGSKPACKKTRGENGNCRESGMRIMASGLNKGLGTKWEVNGQQVEIK
jgi:hypothetical protein